MSLVFRGDIGDCAPLGVFLPGDLSISFFKKEGDRFGVRELLSRSPSLLLTDVFRLRLGVVSPDLGVLGESVDLAFDLTTVFLGVLSLSTSLVNLLFCLGDADVGGLVTDVFLNAGDDISAVAELPACSSVMVVSGLGLTLSVPIFEPTRIEELLLGGVGPSNPLLASAAAFLFVLRTSAGMVTLPAPPLTNVLGLSLSRLLLVGVGGFEDTGV